MSLNMEDPETLHLASELAQRTAESLTVAVTVAIRERLERLRREEGSRLSDRLLLIGKDCARRLNDPHRSAEHDALLYDERGLPR